MCGCTSFTGDDMPSEIMADFNSSPKMNLSFDGEREMYENFLTKKQRDRRKLRRENLEGGMDRKDARKNALASLPRTKLNELFEKLKSGENLKVIETPFGNVELDPNLDERLNEISDALRQKENENANNNELEPTFFEKNKMYIIGAVVLIGGIFVYSKFIKK
jgi:hypothetical protein